MIYLNPTVIDVGFLTLFIHFYHTMDGNGKNRHNVKKLLFIRINFMLK